MERMKEGDLLSINSFELETALYTLGKALIDFGKSNNITSALFNESGADFIDIVATQFLVNLKSEFRLWYVFNDVGRGETIRITADFVSEHEKDILKEHAIELGIFIQSIDGECNIERSDYPKPFLTRIKGRIAYEFSKFLRSFQTAPRIPVDYGKKRLLYSDFYPNSTKVLIPIFKALKRNSRVQQLYVANRREVNEALERAGVSESYPFYLDKAVNRSHDFDIAFKKYELWFGSFVQTFWPFPQRVTKRLHNTISLSLWRKLTWVAGRFPGFKSLIDVFKPHAIILSTNSSPDSKALVAIGNASGIKSFVFQHGIYQNSPFLSFVDATYNCLWGEYHKTLIERWAAGMTSCVVTGSVKHDDFARRFSRHRSDGYILYISTPPSNNVISYPIYVKILRELMHAVESLKEKRFIVKLHPSEDFHRFVTAVPNYKRLPNLTVLQKAPIEELIAKAELVMVVSSSAAYEAFALGKRLITFSIGVQNDILPFRKLGLAMNVGREGELIEAIESSYNMEMRDANKANALIQIDQMALQRCTGLILNSR